MIIRQLRLSGVRSYELYSTEFDPELTLILGQNGTGKTTLLEGLYFLMQGTSFRGRDRDMIAHDSSRATLVLDTDHGSRRAHLQHTVDGKVKKVFEINDKTNARLLARYRLPVVLFEPEELRLLSSSPERRRNFIDGILARLYPNYSAILSRYQRTLMQRNELLKQRENTSSDAWDNQLFIWDMKFAELALEISRQRREFAVVSNSHLSRIYSAMAGSEHHVTVSYLSSISADNYQQKLLNRLHDNLSLIHI